MDNMPDFKFTATHPSQLTFDCSLWLQNGTSSKVYATKTSVANGSLTTLTLASPVANGVWRWWINCTSGTASSISEKWTITVNVFRGDRSFAASYDGSTRYYWLDLPDNFDSSVPTPLVIFLHGYGQDRSMYRTYFPVFRQIFHQNGWIVACTDCRWIGSYHTWYTAPSRSDITDVIDLLDQEFGINRNHIHVMGTSMGGSGTLKYAMFNPDIIASACPIMGVTNFTEFYYWTTDSTLRNSIAAAYGGTPSEVPLVYKDESPLGNEIRFRHTPVFLLHGSADTVVPVSNSRQLNKTLSQAGYVVKYVEVPGVGHYATTLVEGREQEVYEWFRDHPLWGNTHLLLSVQPNQDIYAKGQSLTLSVTVLNQLNPALEGILTLTVSGSGKYGYFDFQTINVTVDAARDYSFEWNIPDVAGTYVVEVSLVPAQLTAYDAVWLKVT
jgi:dipeptidyl aminopeptidase/acylaminoacyl peptidase